MDCLIVGTGMMGQAIAYDLSKYSTFERISVTDKNNKILKEAKKFLDNNDKLIFNILDVKNLEMVKKKFKEYDVIISAIPYHFNYQLSKLSIESGAHFLDLGGNNDIVHQQKTLFQEAINANVTIIPDNGLAPGLVSIITRDIVNHYTDIQYVKIRVGGLPVHPQPPLDYEIVFSPNGLINEYFEDAYILDQGAITTKKSLTEIETISFPPPFKKMEAFITSGGCSTLPFTYKDKIGYLDYKTIRYPGHCEKIKTLFDLGFGSTTSITIKGVTIIPRDLLIYLLNHSLSKTGDDVVLLKVLAHAKKEGNPIEIEYTMIDYKDHKTNLSAMMRTTGFPVSITAELLNNKNISKPGVYCPEEIVPPKMMFSELKKRNIHLHKTEKIT